MPFHHSILSTFVLLLNLVSLLFSLIHHFLCKALRKFKMMGNEECVNRHLENLQCATHGVGHLTVYSGMYGFSRLFFIVLKFM